MWTQSRERNAMTHMSHTWRNRLHNSTCTCHTHHPLWHTCYGISGKGVPCFLTSDLQECCLQLVAPPCKSCTWCTLHRQTFRAATWEQTVAALHSCNSHGRSDRTSGTASKHQCGPHFVHIPCTFGTEDNARQSVWQGQRASSCTFHGPRHYTWCIIESHLFQSRWLPVSCTLGTS